MATTTQSVTETCLAAKRAAGVLATLDADTKDRALEAIAVSILDRTADILQANERDLDAGRESGLSHALLDRLALDHRRIAEMAVGVRKIASLPDPVGEVIDGETLPNR